MAGVVVGQSLINQSKLRTIASEFNEMKLQFNTFNLKYSSFPGDMPNAHDYWPGCNSGSTESQCNGDGNKKIDFGADDSDRESMRYWQHLYLDL